MSTRSFARNLFPPLDNPELTIRSRSNADPTLLDEFDMTTEGNGDPPVPDLQTIEELCQLSLNGQGLSGDDANKHLDKFLHVTQSIKVNRVTNEAFRLYLFPHTLTYHATTWFDRLPRNSINTFDQMAKRFLGKYFPPSMLTKLRNEIINFRQRPDESLFKAWEGYKLSIDRCPNHNMLHVTQIDTFYNGLTLRHRDTINVAAAQRSDSSSSITSSFDPEIAALKAEMPPLAKPRTYMLWEPIIQVVTPTNLKPVVAPVNEVVVSPVSAPKPNQKPSILYLSRLHDLKLRDKANDQKDKIFQIFQDLNFNISFADALILMPKFGPTIKTWLTNKDKLFELARTPLNEHCSAVLLKKLPKKLGDPDKFLIPCDFLGMDECLALANLGTIINLMPLSVWNKLSLLELSPMCMTLELTNSLISRSVEVAEDVFVKVGTFHFPVDFVVVDFDADPRVPLIIERSFQKTEKALIDVYEGELTLRVGKEAITFNLDKTSRYSANYNDMTANQINVIDMAYEEYSQEVIGFSDVIKSCNPTPYYDPIVSTSSSTLTPFGDSDFLLEEVGAFLALEDDPTSLEVDHSYYDLEGDIFLLEAFLNDDPSLPPPTQGKYLP
nr:reverse transcriptase domain-containing protein [Tanacetum cinerariifolium]